jgi:hypothetical protein
VRKHGSNPWRCNFYISTVSPGFVFAGSIPLTGLTPFVPNSPKYLYIQCADEVGARKSLDFYHDGVKEVDMALDIYEQERAVIGGVKFRLIDVFRCQHVRMSVSHDYVGSDCPK